MSIVQSIDAEISGVNEEIAALEAQLDGKRGRLSKLNELREQAEALIGEGGGLPDPAPTPAAPKPARSTSPGSSAGRDRRAEADLLWPPREAKVLEVIANAGGDGLSPAGIREATGLSKQQVEITIRKLGEKVRAEGTRKSRRYFTEGAARPSDAPTNEGRAASAPPRKEHARRDLEAVDAHNAIRDRVQAAILDVLEERPTGKDQVTAKVLERVPEASARMVTTVRAKLAQAHKIETRANKLQLTGVDRSQPITALEKEVVACLGSGRTVKEVAANCKLVRNAFSARSVLMALEQREIVTRRGDSETTVYVAVDQKQQEAAAS